MNANPWLKRSVWLLVFGCLVGCFWLFPLDVSASSPFQSVPPPPPNDNFADAIPLGQAPFQVTGTTEGATAVLDEPSSSCSYYGAANTVWYVLQVSEKAPLMVSVNGDFSVVWTVYSGTTLESLQQQVCGNFWGGSGGFLAQPDTTYYVQVGSIYGNTGQFSLALDPAPPPSASINYYQPNPWAFTPIQFSPYVYDPIGIGFNKYVWDFGDGTTVEAVFAQHAYVQAGKYTVSLTVTTVDGRMASATQEITIEPLPPLTVGINMWPEDPSTYDAIQFWPYTYDLAQHPVVSYLWNFGDGTISTAQNGVHQYAKEGLYTVVLTVGTDDGRTAQSSRSIKVENHDVMITKVNVPSSARTLLTKQISVGVNSKYHDETVAVTLYKSVYGTYQSFESVGSSTQFVQAQAVNKNTQFVFNYTFTAADAQAGSVTFKAVAEIVGKRDLQEANNTYISLPVKVSAGKVSGASVEEDGVLLFLPAVADN